MEHDGHLKSHLKKKVALVFGLLHHLQRNEPKLGIKKINWPGNGKIFLFTNWILCSFQMRKSLALVNLAYNVGGQG